MDTKTSERLQADLVWASWRIEALLREVAEQLRAQARQRRAAARRLARALR